MAEKNVVLFELLFSILVDNFLGFSFEIFLIFEFTHIVMETVNVIVQLVKLLVEFFERSSINVPKFTNDDRIKHSQVPQWLQNGFRVEKFRRLLGVRFYTSYKMTIARVKLFNEGIHWVKEFATEELFGWVSASFLIGIRFLGDFLANAYFFYWRGGGFFEDAEKLLREFVFVFGSETGGDVTDGTARV